MTQKERISDLNKFFSKVTYDYYNIPMAILLSFYKNKFKPMSYNEILKEILSRKDAKKKLRKSTGEEYSGLELALKNLLNNRKKIFKKVFEEDDNEPKYSMILDHVQRLWEFNLQSMSKIKHEINKSQSKISKHRDFLDYDSDEKIFDYGINNGLLSKKTKRKNFSSDEESKDNKLAGFSIYHPKGYKSNLKANKKRGSSSQSSNSINEKDNEEEDNIRSRSMNKIDKLEKEDNSGYLSDELGKNNFNNLIGNKGRGLYNNLNLKNLLSKNNIYEKIPRTDENMLNNIMDKFSKLGQKIKEIQSELKCLVLSKTIQKYFNENNKKEEKQKTLINNYYNEINSLLEKKEYNPDNFKVKYELLKRGMSSYLEIYENSYENLFRVLFEKNNILESVYSKKEENLQKDINECFNGLNKFINVNKKQINDSFHFLSNFTRNFYLKRFENIIAKIDTRHKDNMIEMEESNKMKEKLLLSKSIGKNVKYFNVQKINNATGNQNEICVNNNMINNNIIMNNKMNNNIISSRIIDYTEYNRDAPPAGNINFNHNNKIIQNLEVLFNSNPSNDKNNNIKINNIVSEEYNDIMCNENNDSNDNGFMSDNSKGENKEMNNNENEIYGENEKFDIDSNNIFTTPSFHNNEFSVGDENNC